MPVEEPVDEPGGQVPDDARDLGRDVTALERERRAAHRRQQVGGLLLTRRWHRYGVSGPLVAAVLVLVAVFGALLVVLRPSFPERAGPEPLAAPAVAPGTPGGLLPDGPVDTPGGATTTRALDRPGVLVLVPLPCTGACDAVLREVVDEALQVTRDVRLLTRGEQDRDGAAADALRRGPGRGLVDSGVDRAGALPAAYGATGVTVLFVGPDGVVLDVVPDVAPGQRLDAEVGRLQARERATG